MRSNLMMNRIKTIQYDYKNLLSVLLPKLKSAEVLDALDEINLFWYRHISEIDLFLKNWICGEECFVFTASTFLDFEDNEHLPFLLMGTQHILDDPLSRYAEIHSQIQEDVISKVISEQIFLTAEDNIKILENVQDEIIILPLRLLNQTNDLNELNFQAAESAFISLFNGIDSIEDYYNKCTTIEDIMTYARQDIGSLVLFSEDDEVSLPFEERFKRASLLNRDMVDVSKSDSYVFFFLVLGNIQQAVNVLLSCLEYECIPYIRYSIAFHYILMLSENMLNLEFMNTLRYKMSIAFSVYQLFNKCKFDSVSFAEFIQKRNESDFNSKVFDALEKHKINEHNFWKESIAAIIKSELDFLYGSIDK